MTSTALTDISNSISNKVSRKMTEDEIGMLIGFISELPPQQVAGLSYVVACNRVADEFLNRKSIKNIIKSANLATDPVVLTGLEHVTTDPTIVDYQVKELMQLTPNEHQNKFTSFADRRGNAVVDSNRVLGNSSSPDSLPSGRKISADDVNRSNFQALKLVNDFLDPQNIQELLSRSSSSYATFLNINLPRTTVPIDSRNRLLSDTNPNQYKFNLHSSGSSGSLGDIRIMDTLQQIISVSIGDFILPMSPAVGSSYQKIRMVVNEFSNQSSLVTQFLTSNTSSPTVTYFQFEFDIKQIVGNQVYLTPTQNTRTYIFKKPISSFSTFTIQFYTPYDLYLFPIDRGVYTITYGNPTSFTVNSAPSHGLSTGSLIYVLNSTSGSASIDAALTNTAGYFITKTGATSFTIPVDSSALIGTQSGVNVYYGAFRVFFNLEFISLEQ